MGRRPNPVNEAVRRRLAAERWRRARERQNLPAEPPLEERTFQYPEPVVLPDTDPAVLQKVVILFDWPRDHAGRHELHDLERILTDRLGLYARRVYRLMLAERTSGQRGTSVLADAQRLISDAAGRALDGLLRRKGGGDLDQSTRFDGLDTLVMHCSLSPNATLIHAYLEALDLIRQTLGRVELLRDCAHKDFIEKRIWTGAARLPGAFAKAGIVRNGDRSDLFVDFARIALLAGMSAAPLWVQHANKALVWATIRLCGVLARAHDGEAVLVAHELKPVMWAILHPEGLVDGQSLEENMALAKARALTLKVVGDCLDVRQLLIETILSMSNGYPLMIRVDLAGAVRAKARKLQTNP